MQSAPTFDSTIACSSCASFQPGGSTSSSISSLILRIRLQDEDLPHAPRLLLSSSSAPSSDFAAWCPSSLLSKSDDSFICFPTRGMFKSRRQLPFPTIFPDISCINSWTCPALKGWTKTKKHRSTGQQPETKSGRVPRINRSSTASPRPAPPRHSGLGFDKCSGLGFDRYTCRIQSPKIQRARSYGLFRATLDEKIRADQDGAEWFGQGTIFQLDLQKYVYMCIYIYIYI